MAIDKDELKRSVLISDVVSQRIEIKKSSPDEWSAHCPFHDDDTPSLSIDDSKGVFYCFGCGETGDMFGFVQKYDNVDFQTALSLVSGDTNITPVEIDKKPSVKKDYLDGIEPIIPVPPEIVETVGDGKSITVRNPKNKDLPGKKYEVTYKPAKTYTYTDNDGQVIGYVLRIEFPPDEKGKRNKITPRVMFCRFPNGDRAFCYFRFARPTPMYRVMDLDEHPDKPVLWVEGEKCADASKKILPKYVSVASVGGANSYKHVDTTPLKGRDILVWPDNDLAGNRAAWEVLVPLLQNSGVKSLKVIDYDPEKPDHWDVADALEEGMTTEEVVLWAKQRVRIITLETDPIFQPEPEAPDFDIPDDYKYDPDDDGTPFRVLGFNKARRYYLPTSTRQVVELTPAQHTPNNLLSIAPLDWWRDMFPKNKSFDPDWTKAYDYYLQVSSRVLFDGHEMLRGRGAWLDDGRSVLHLGSTAYVDGIPTRPWEIDSRYIYEHAFDISMDHHGEASNKEAHKLVEICNQLSWANELSGNLLAGWCVIASVCGMLEWRPHIWVTGPSGSGKTTVLSSIIMAMLGKIAVEFQGGTSEAGIRQAIGQDARPILYDEADAEDEATRRRLQSVIGLSRIASSGGKIIKGTQDQTGRSFSMRSCFCFSAINPSVQEFADESRITKLTLHKDKSAGATDKYRKLEKLIAETLTEEYASKVLFRSLKHLSVLQQNIKIFTRAATSVFRSKRIADQVGPMLAGAYLCHSAELIDVEDAIDWIGKRDWQDHTVIGKKSDAERLVDTIFTHRVQIKTDRLTTEQTIGELVTDAAIKSMGGEAVSNIELKRYGLSVDAFAKTLTVANTSLPMKKILRDTPWQAGWSRTLLEFDGSKKTNTIYFTAGVRSRAVEIQLDQLFPKNE